MGERFFKLYQDRDFFSQERDVKCLVFLFWAHSQSAKADLAQQIFSNKSLITYVMICLKICPFQLQNSSREELIMMTV